MSKIIVNGLWVGKKLSNLEQLTLHSFTNFNCEFHLWHYDPIQTSLPNNVVLRNANEIIPSDQIFRYPSNMLIGVGNDSFIGFSELFKFKFLYENGGWWSDLDVTCLKTLSDIEDDYWFRFHGIFSMIGSTMKCPAKSDLMMLCYNKAAKEINHTQHDYCHSIRILCFYVELLGLADFIHYGVSNIDETSFINRLMLEDMTIPDSWRFIHWVNSVNSKNYSNGSTLDKLYLNYGLKNKTIFI